MLVLAYVAPAQGDVVPGAIHSYDAGLDTDGDASWEDIGTSIFQNNILLFAADYEIEGGPTRVSVSSSTLITHAYEFDGVDDFGDINSHNRSGNHDATFDMWFKPNGFEPSSPGEMGLARTIYDNGNDPRGLSIGLNGDMLIFTFASSPNEGYLMYDLDTNDDGVPDNEDFIHVTLTINDASNDADPNADWIRLYVDGGNEQQMDVPGQMNWTSNDIGGMATIVAQGGGGQDATAELGIEWGGHFAGQVAYLREYEFTFTAEQVMQNYLAMTPSAVPGDGNGDGAVDGFDYLIWAGNFGDNPADDPPGAPGNGDFNDDGVVNGFDYLVWAGGFTGSATAIPEPSAVLLGLWGLLGIWGAAGRRRRV